MFVMLAVSVLWRQQDDPNDNQNKINIYNTGILTARYERRTHA